MYHRLRLIIVFTIILLSCQQVSSRPDDGFHALYAATACRSYDDGKCRSSKTEGFYQCLQCIQPWACVSYQPCINWTLHDHQPFKCYEFAAESPQIYTPDTFGCQFRYYWVTVWSVILTVLGILIGTGWLFYLLGAPVSRVAIRARDLWRQHLPWSNVRVPISIFLIPHFLF
jgi:hypothetical protein